MILFLDTHIVVWLFDKKLDLLSVKSKELINEESVLISPMVKLELEYLYEIGKVKDQASAIIDYLYNKIDLKTDNIDLLDIVNIAVTETWTRDPFDRLIVSQCKFYDAHLITQDERIRKNYFRVIG